MLGIAAGLVLAATVYLFVEVRSTPAAAQPSHAATSADRGPDVGGAQPVDPPPAAPPAPKWDPGPHAQVGPPLVGRPDVAAMQRATPPPGESVDDQLKGEHANPRLEMVMREANQAYDHTDYDEAMAIAGKILAKDPTNVRMLRVMVSSACMEGDSITAQKYYAQLPKPDQAQMRVRCSDKSGITFTDSP